MINLPGYEIKEVLYESPVTLSYKGLRVKDGLSVILKTSFSAYPSLEDIARLNHEFELGKSLKANGVSKYLGIEKTGNRNVLVIEDFEAITLKRYVQKFNPDLKEKLQIALKLVLIIEGLHADNILHKDIKPENILVNPSTGEIKLIDMGFASRVKQGTGMSINAGKFSGTIDYMSPEQTGRMNRGVDLRSDLYSFGILLYELFTGKVPFSSVDAAEVIHAHIARQPEPPPVLNPKIPSTLSAVILKLLAKTPEDRYQTASGLRKDIEKLNTLFQATGTISDFSVGQSDVSPEFRVPQKLYGREAELARLLEITAKVRKGSTELLFVSGEAGIGKSWLINEIQAPLLKARGIYLQGKFDQYSRSTPYSALAQAIAQLPKYLLSKGETEFGVWRNKICDAMGNIGQVLLDLAPEMELIIGQQAPLPVLTPEETQARFRHAIVIFLNTLASAQHPLLLFLDDLQWADIATLRMIEEIAGESISGLLLVGAYRDNEVGESHALTKILENIESFKPVHKLKIHSLKKEAIAELLSDTLRTDASQLQDFSQMVHEKTGGNPFFVARFLIALYEEGLIRFLPDKGEWVWDLENIRRHNITGNVAELLTSKIKRLPDETQKVLCLAAAIGNLFSIDSVAHISGISKEDAASRLKKAVEEGLIIAQDDRFEWLITRVNNASSNPEPEVTSEEIELRFIHDRVQQASYLLIPEEERPSLHLRAGRRLLEKTQADSKMENLFDVLYHFNQASDLVKDEGERLVLSKLNLEAGNRAKASSAFKAAADFYKAGTVTLPEDCWEKHFELALVLNTEKTECEVLAGDEIEEKISAFRQLLQRVKTPLEKLLIYRTMLRLTATRGKIGEAVEIGLEGLKIYGIHIPKSNFGLKMAILSHMLRVMIKLRGKTPEKLLKYPKTEDKEIIELIGFMSQLNTAAFLVKPEIFVVSLLKEMMLALRHGHTDPADAVFLNYGILQLMFGSHEKAYAFGKLNLDLFSQTFKRKGNSARLEFLFNGMFDLWKHDTRPSAGLALELFNRFLELGDPVWAGFTLNFRVWQIGSLGYNLEKIEAECENYLDFLSKNMNAGSKEAVIPRRIFGLCLLGKTSNPSLLQEGDFSFEKNLDDCIQRKSNSTAAGIVSLQLQLNFLSGNYEAGEKLLPKGDELIVHFTGFYYFAEYQIFKFLVLAKLYPSKTGWARRKAWKALKKLEKLFARWNSLQKENFGIYFDIAQAELARLNGDAEKAEAGYEKAIETASSGGFLQYEAIVNELAGEYYASHGKSKAAKPFILDAWYGYRRWGAVAIAKKLEEKYPAFLRTPGDQFLGNNKKMESLSHTGFSSDLIDMDSVIKASSAISQKIQIRELLSTLINILIQNAGAQRGLLLLNRDGKWVIDAEGETNLETPRVMQELPIEGQDKFPVSLFRFVERTQKPVVIGDAIVDTEFGGDPYVKSKQVRSALMMPVVHNGVPIGVFYLENNLAAHAFTNERMELLKILSGQIAISLYNALLYENLEQKVIARTEEIRKQKDEISRQKDEIQEERNLSEKLLLNILPQKIAEELKVNKHAAAHKFEKATVIFADIVGFSKISESLDPESLVAELDYYFSAFDQITTEFGIEKVKTIGDAYMAVAGVPSPGEDDAGRAILASLAIRDFVLEEAEKRKNSGKVAFSLRLGLHTGPVVAGVVGTTKFAYDIWGETVNLAARMESSGEPGKVNITGATYELVKNRFAATFRGKIQAKNIGEVDMYFVEKK